MLWGAGARGRRAGYARRGDAGATTGVPESLAAPNRSLPGRVRRRRLPERFSPTAHDLRACDARKSTIFFAGLLGMLGLANCAAAAGATAHQNGRSWAVLPPRWAVPGCDQKSGKPGLRDRCGGRRIRL